MKRVRGRKCGVRGKKNYDKNRKSDIKGRKL